MNAAAWIAGFSTAGRREDLGTQAPVKAVRKNAQSIAGTEPAGLRCGWFGMELPVRGGDGWHKFASA